MTESIQAQAESRREARQEQTQVETEQRLLEVGPETGSRIKFLEDYGNIKEGEVLIIDSIDEETGKYILKIEDGRTLKIPWSILFRKIEQGQAQHEMTRGLAKGVAINAELLAANLANNNRLRELMIEGIGEMLMRQDSGKFNNFLEEVLREENLPDNLREQIKETIIKKIQADLEQRVQEVAQKKMMWDQIARTGKWPAAALAIVGGGAFFGGIGALGAAGVFGAMRVGRTLSAWRARRKARQEGGIEEFKKQAAQDMVEGSWLIRKFRRIPVIRLAVKSLEQHQDAFFTSDEIAALISNTARQETSERIRDLKIKFTNGPEDERTIRELLPEYLASADTYLASLGISEGRERDTMARALALSQLRSEQREVLTESDAEQFRPKKDRLTEKGEQIYQAYTNWVYGAEVARRAQEAGTFGDAFRLSALYAGIGGVVTGSIRLASAVSPEAVPVLRSIMGLIGGFGIGKIVNELLDKRRRKQAVEELKIRLNQYSEDLRFFERKDKLTEDDLKDLDDRAQELKAYCSICDIKSLGLELVFKEYVVSLLDRLEKLRVREWQRRQQTEEQAAEILNKIITDRKASETDSDETRELRNLREETLKALQANTAWDNARRRAVLLASIGVLGVLGSGALVPSEKPQPAAASTAADEVSGTVETAEQPVPQLPPEQAVAPEANPLASSVDGFTSRHGISYEYSLEGRPVMLVGDEFYFVDDRSDTMHDIKGPQVPSERIGQIVSKSRQGLVNRIRYSDRLTGRLVATSTAPSTQPSGAQVASAESVKLTETAEIDISQVSDREIRQALAVPNVYTIVDRYADPNLPPAISHRIFDDKLRELYRLSEELNRVEPSNSKYSQLTEEIRQKSAELQKQFGPVLHRRFAAPERIEPVPVEHLQDLNMRQLREMIAQTRIDMLKAFSEDNPDPNKIEELINQRQHLVDYYSQRYKINLTGGAFHDISDRDLAKFLHITEKVNAQHYQEIVKRGQGSALLPALAETVPRRPSAVAEADAQWQRIRELIIARSDGDRNVSPREIPFTPEDRADMRASEKAETVYRVNPEQWRVEHNFEPQINTAKLLRQLRDDNIEVERYYQELSNLSIDRLAVLARQSEDEFLAIANDPAATPEDIFKALQARSAIVAAYNRQTVTLYPDRVRELDAMGVHQGMTTVGSGSRGLELGFRHFTTGRNIGMGGNIGRRELRYLINRIERDLTDPNDPWRQVREAMQRIGLYYPKP